MTINEIKNTLKTTPVRELSDRIAEFESDTRAGVLRAVEDAKKRISEYEAELVRLDEMFYFEKKYRPECKVICGIDEVGRGPLAGPVVAGAVVLPEDAPYHLEDPEGMNIFGLNDSKQVSGKRREALYEEIMDKAVATGLGQVSAARIDEINILQATYEAMRQAIKELPVKPDILLNDAVTIPEVDIKQVPIIKGDAKSISIGAASIIAKVYRDGLMKEYDSIYPGYGFSTNMGYGTAEHIKALKELGPTPIHRRTFIHNYI